VDASSTAAPFPSTATPAETRSSRADDIEHGRYYDHDEGGSLAILTDGLRRPPPRRRSFGAWRSDTDVPVQGARLLAEQLRSRSTEPVVYAELPGGQHSFDLFQSIRFENVVDGIDAFVAWVISRPGQQTSSARQVSLPGLTCSPTPHVTAGRLSGTCMYSSWDRRVTPAAC
jgi:hypothetical protein